MNISLDVKETEISVVIFVTGEIDAYTAPKLREKLFPLSETNGVQMIVDLTGVSYMDSTGLGVFVGVFKNVRANEGHFKIIGLSSRLHRLFEVTGLADIIDISSQIEGGVQ